MLYDCRQLEKQNLEKYEKNRNPTFLSCHCRKNENDNLKKTVVSGTYTYVPSI